MMMMHTRCNLYLLQIFREVAYKCRDLDDLIAGVDEFVAQVTVLPPGEWDPKIRIEPPNKVPPQVSHFPKDMDEEC